MTQPPRQPFGPPQHQQFPPPGSVDVPPKKKRRTGLVVLGVIGGLLLALVAVAVIWRIVFPPEKVHPRDYQELQVAAFNVNLAVQGIEDSINQLIIAEGAPDEKIAAVEKKITLLAGPVEDIEKNRAYAEDPHARQKVDAVRAGLGPYRKGVEGYVSSVRPVQKMRGTCAPLGKSFRLSGDVAGWKVRSKACDDAIRAAGSVTSQQALVTAYRTWLDRLTQAHEATASAQRTGDRAQTDRASKLQGDAGRAMSDGLRRNAGEFARALDTNAATIRTPVGELREYATARAR